MLLPNRKYTNTSLTEQAVYNITGYQKIIYHNNFNTSKQRWQGSSGMTTTVANGKLEASSNVVDEDVTIYYHTKPGKKYRLNLNILYATADSIDLKLHSQSPQTLLISDTKIANGHSGYNFTATTDSIRLRLKRKDHSRQGILSFYIDRILLKEIRDTFYQDTVIIATGNGYRYGFNGAERDDEIKGSGNSLDFGNRILDTRLGRFLSIDKYASKYPGESNYTFASNMLISAIDINGDSTYIIVAGAGYLNYTLKGKKYDNGNSFLLNANALKKKIESSANFDKTRDEVIVLKAPSTERFIKAVNKNYKSGKIASLTVFSHGYGFSQSNGTNTGE